MNSMRHCIACLLVLGISACSSGDDASVPGYFEGEYQYIASSQAGYLSALNVHRGQAVTVGQPLFALDPSPVSEQVQQAEATLQQSQATLADIQRGKRPDEIKQIEADIAATDAAIAFYQKQVVRYEHLVEKDFASEEDYDNNKYKHDVAVAKKANYEASLALAKLGNRADQIEAQQQVVAENAAYLKEIQWQESQTKQTSASAGLVFDTFYLKGEWVPAGSPVVSLLLPQQMRVIFFVPERVLAKVHVGDAVTVTCEQCDHLQATVSYISTENEYTPPVIFSEDMRDKLVYEVKATLPPAVALQYHPGQPVTVLLPGAKG